MQKIAQRLKKQTNKESNCQEEPNTSIILHNKKYRDTEHESALWFLVINDKTWSFKKKLRNNDELYD